jgi:hypothetical protein
MSDTELDEMLNTWKTPAPPPSLLAGLRTKFPARRARRMFGLPVRWLAFALGAGALAFGISLAEDGVLSSDGGWLDDATYIRRTRIVEPPAAILKWIFMGGLSTGWKRQAGGSTGSVYLYDRLSHVHYGYTWVAQPHGAGQYQFTVGGLDRSVLRERGAIAPFGAPAPKILGAGDSFEVNLYESGGERVYDRIELSKPQLPVVTHEQPSRTAGITLTNPQLYINGQFALGSGGVAEVKGATAFVELAGRGRYVLALDPQGNSAFRRAGFLEGDSMEFESDGVQFRVQCSAPVAQGGRRPLFVFSQPGIAVDQSKFGAGGPASILH